MLNICDVIWVCVPVDLSILVIWKIVLPAVAGEARLAKTLKYALCPFILPFPVFCDTVTVFSDLFAMICENKESRRLFLTMLRFLTKC